MPSPFTHNQALSQAILSTAIFSQGFNFFTVFLIHSHCEVPPWCVSKVKFLKFRSPDCWKHHFWLQKYSLDILDKHFFLSILWFGDKCTQNCITQTGPYDAEYQRNGKYLCIGNKHDWDNYKRFVPDPQDWP